MNDFLQKLPVLIISSLVLIMIGVLVETGRVSPDNPLVTTAISPILTFWIVAHTSTWQRVMPTTPAATQSSRASSAYSPVPQRASRTTSYTTAPVNEAATPVQPQPPQDTSPSA